jgi:hypothetical protein
MTNSRHHRIFESGEVIALESLWEFGFPHYDGDPEQTKREQEEIWSKNKKVEEILSQKGIDVAIETNHYVGLPFSILFQEILL